MQKTTNPRERILKVLLRILTNPHKYSRPELARYFNTSIRNIKRDTEIINTLPEIELHYKAPPYKCYIEPKNKYSELKKFAPLNEEDKYYLKQALNYLPNKSLRELLETKVEGLYDFQQLGLQQLRHPAIERINRLEEGKNREKKVILKKYRSNQSNKTRDKLVEPHLVNPELDTLQAFDYDHQETRHFRLSRIQSVEITEQDWEHKLRHTCQSTDIFRIADNHQVTVKLRLQVRAYNMLTEHFPMSKTYLDPDSIPNHFIFQANVNHNFYGLMPFILGNYAFLEILAPDNLKAAVKAQAKIILDKF